ncbi:MAG: hypothetical protein ACFE96_06730, partial [Candidatus Hermodarchaeota archaeon]
FQFDYHTAIILSQLVTPDNKGTKQAIQKLLASEILKEPPSKDISNHIEARLNSARAWIKSRYSPNYLRIQLNEHVSTELVKQYDGKIRNLVLDLGKKLKKARWTEDVIKQEMITLKEEMGISRKDMKLFFELLYKIFLDNSKGPRFAPFLASLDKDWVINKFQELRKFIY